MPTPEREAGTLLLPARECAPDLARWARPALLGLFWAVGYFSLGIWVTPRFDPSVALDTSIPFTSWGVWVYLAGIAWIVAPLWLIRDQGDADRTFLRYGLAISVAFLCFALFQTDGRALRIPGKSVDIGPATTWAVSLLRRIDPPTNLMPSLHVTLAWLASWAIGGPHRRSRAVCTLVAVAVTCAVCLAKQHTLLDVASGLLLALLCRGVVRDQPPCESPVSIQPASRR